MCKKATECSMNLEPLKQVDGSRKERSLVPGHKMTIIARNFIFIPGFTVGWLSLENDDSLIVDSVRCKTLRLA
jgi:hypothetical protein